MQHPRILPLMLLLPLACELAPDEDILADEISDLPDTETGGGYTEADPLELLGKPDETLPVCGGPPGGCCIQACSTCMWNCVPSTAAGSCPGGGTYRPCDAGECYDGGTDGVCVSGAYSMGRCCG